jgi:hypothetical protein
MKKITDILLKTAVAVLAMSLAASCIFEKVIPLAEDDTKTVLVQLNVGSGSMINTKAEPEKVTPVQGGEVGTDTEINTLRVFAYRKVTKDREERYEICGFLYATGNRLANASTSALLMDIRLPYTQMNSEQTIYFKAIANAEGIQAAKGMLSISVGRNEDGSIKISENIGYEELDAIAYSIPATQTFEKGMPLYCSTSATINLAATGTTVTGVPGHAGHTHTGNSVTLNMTRPLAKIDVFAAEASSGTASGASTAGIQITSVDLVNAYAEGLLFGGSPEEPALFEDQNSYMTIQNGGEVNSSVIENDKADPSKYGGPVTKSFYLAPNAVGIEEHFSYGEWTSDDALATAANGATALKIGYKVSATAEPKYGYVVMPPIEGNTYYKVLARITAGGELALTFQVQPWSLEQMDLTYEDVLESNKSATWKYEGETTEINPDKKGYINLQTRRNLEFNFKFDNPKGARWKASLIPMNQEAQDYGFIGDDGKKLIEEGVVGSDVTLRIDPGVSGSEVKLKVTLTTADGHTMYVTARDFLPDENVEYNDFTIIVSK